MAYKFNLPHDTTYKVLGSNYLSLEDGGGESCNNCNKIITTCVLVEDADGNIFTVGSDCAMTLAGINNEDERKINLIVKECKKFYKELKKNPINKVIEKDENTYVVIRVVEPPRGSVFIHNTFTTINKKNFSEIFNNRIITKDDIIADFPELKDNYYIKNGF